MRLNNYENRHDLLIDWVLETVPRGAAILDIGAGDGSFCPEVRRLYEHAGFLAGVDPDTVKLNRHPMLHGRYAGKIEEADIPDAKFDCLCAIYVFEHVQDEGRFLHAASRVLKPGGSLFFITPNGRQYFAFIAAALGRLGLQARVLGMVREKELVDRYHCPSLYRLNSAARLRKLGGTYGFGECEFRYCERFEEFACYFPGPLKVFPWAWERMALLTGREQMLGNLIGRMLKTGASV